MNRHDEKQGHDKWAHLCTVLILATFLSALAQAAPPPGLVADGLPEIPQSILDTTARYNAATANVFMDWDPNSGAMLMSSVSEETKQLHVLLGPEGETRLSTLFPDVVASGSFMPKKGDLVVFAADHLGDEFYQLYSLDAATGKTQLLTDGQSRNTEVIYGHSGLQIAYRSTAREGKDPDIFVMDPRKPDSVRLLMNIQTTGWTLQDWAHDDHHILVAHNHTSTIGYLWSINTDSGETKLLTEDPSLQHPYTIARYTPNDDGVYAVARGTDNLRTLEWLPLSPQAKPPKIPLNATHVEDIRLSPDGSLLAYSTEEKDGDQLHIFNTTTGEEIAPPSLPAGLIHRMRWNTDGTELGFSYGTSETPLQAYSYVILSGELKQWTKLDATAAQMTQVKPELIQIQSFDELPISGYLYRPNPQKFPGKRPVLISIHGGPADEFKPRYLGAYNYYVNELGVALFYPNVRGSAGFGQRFMDLDNGLNREDAVKDIGAFLDWIQTDPQLDGDRVGVEGTSYGGYMALATLYHYNNRVRCGSDLMGITDFVTFLQNTTPYRQADRRSEYGDERYPDMNKFLESVSPLNHAAEIHDPIMITAGKNDPRVPVSESDQMVKAMRAENGIVWYMLGENEGHGFRRVSDAKYQFAAEAYFFQTYLLPEKRLTPLFVTPTLPVPNAVGPD